MIRFLKPEMPPPESWAQDVLRVYESGQFTNFGQVSRKLEIALEDHFSSTAFIWWDYKITMVNNATTGLELAIRAVMGQGNGTKKIAVPAFTFPATISAIANAGYIPHYLDIFPPEDEEFAYLANFESFDKRKNLDVVGFLPVAVFGRSIPSKYLKLAKEKFQKIIVDSAPAFYTLKVQDGHADAYVVSMHATKAVPCGEGGFIISMACYDERIRILMNFGLKDGRQNLPPTLGATNGKLPEISACVGLQSLERSQDVLWKKERVFKWFGCGVGDYDWHLLPVRVQSSEKMKKKMDIQGIECKRYYEPLTTNGVPESWKVYQTLLCLPYHSSLTKEAVEQIKEVLL